jgi:hypothetical protein
MTVCAVMKPAATSPTRPTTPPKAELAPRVAVVTFAMSRFTFAWILSTTGETSSTIFHDRRQRAEAHRHVVFPFSKIKKPKGASRAPDAALKRRRE